MSNLAIAGVKAVVQGCAYSLTAKAFTRFNPIGGFYFGIAHAISRLAIDCIYKAAKIDTTTRQAKCIQGIVSFLGANTLAALTTTALGYPISFGSALGFSIVTSIAASVTTIGLALVFGHVIAAGVILHKMYQDRCTPQEALNSTLNDLRTRCENLIKVLEEASNDRRRLLRQIQ
jgi:hypothetical protein